MPQVRVGKACHPGSRSLFGDPSSGVPEENALYTNLSAAAQTDKGNGWD